eukprot:CAMPEP_0203928060 /NCGR_PEP_ID=MMETSP0359-20131031/67408_1 /ASSEMBLY_ACC=CAM_ASM_000338 /TAXON_ID=268821 /ORGANISM="Scrippsiella Hangoei, Strain SHTV-5" /LENGTH=271 /DNA_ID=CAMNT_0050856939 /DNA_START=58 /DNA_END=870 /DNA_ORIENTATION=-
MTLSPSLRPPVSDLVSESLKDHNARHLMLLTTMGAALPLLFSHGLVPASAPVLVGSTFPDDCHDLYLIQHVNRVKAAMAVGETIILWNLDRIYESLYDVLNQRYVVRTSGGRTRRSLRLAIGARSQLCPVEEGFRLIVVVEQDHAHQNLDLPLLNRFEKFQMNPEHLLEASQVDAAAQLGEWMSSVADESGMRTVPATFCGVHAGTSASLLLAAALDERTKETQQDATEYEALERARQHLAALATPFAFMRSTRLRSVVLPEEAERHANLA